MAFRKSALLSLAVATITVPLAIGAVTQWADVASLRDIRREAREFLGLPKIWVTHFNTDATGYQRQTCPGRDAIVIVTGGQSNAANSYDALPRPVDTSGAFMFLDGNCYALRSPVLGSTGQRDSLWPALGAAIHAQTGKPVLFINGAVGGVQLGDWLDKRSGYFDRLAKQIGLARRHGWSPRFVLWIQGETDAFTLIAPATYITQQRTLIDRFVKSGLTTNNTRWIIYRSTRCKHRRGNGPDIDRAMTEFAAHSANIVAGPIVSNFDDRYRHDQCHLNTLGRDRLVRESMDTLRPYLAADPAGT